MKKELFFHVLFILSIVFLIAFPLYKKYSYAPSGTFYVKPHGALIDYYYYLSQMRQGHTSFQTVDLHTVEDTQETGIHVFYAVIGRIAATIHVSDIDMYHFSIYAALCVYYLFVYANIRMLVGPRYRWIAMFIVFFASPFPPVSINLFGKSLYVGTDEWTRMEIYKRLLLVPHHFWGIALLICAVYFILSYIKKRKGIYVAAASVVCFLGITIYSVPFFILIGVLGSVSLISLFHPRLRKENRSIFAGLFVILSVCILAMIRIYFVLSRLPTKNTIDIMAWEYATFTPEQFPHIFSLFFLSYGILPPFVLLYLFLAKTKQSFTELFFTFFALYPFAFYLLSMWGFLHINKQRFAFSAPYFFCAVISVWALERLVKAIQKKGKKFISWGRLLRWGIVLIFLINAGTGLYYYWRSELYQKDIYYNVYIADEAMRSLTYIDKMIPPLSKIMTTYYTGMFVPAFTTQKVFIGHDVSTLDFGTKWWYSNALFDGRLTPQEAKDLFVRYGIQYLYWDRGDIFEKYQPLVIELYRDGWMRVYKVR